MESRLSESILGFHQRRCVLDEKIKQGVRVKSCGNRILLLAGEESGLLYADELKKRLSGNEIRGYQDYGFETHDMAVMGILPVLLRLRYFLRLKKRMERVIDEWKPDVVVTVDYPGMNLGLAAYAHARGIRTVHVVCPQVWAWKRGRIPKIEASLDRLCCFLPFEPKIFKPGFATFVGHPLASAFSVARTAVDGRRGMGNGEQGTGGAVKTVALLPGSRKGEIEKILPVLLESAEKLALEFGDKVRFVIPAATPRAYSQIEKLICNFPFRSSRSVPVLQRGGARELLRMADCAAVASGTATLEAALARCPTILVYRMTATFGWFVRHFVKGTRFAGLANIIWDRCRPGGVIGDDSSRENKAIRDPDQPMPELIQENFTSEAVCGYLRGYLADDEVRASAVRRLDFAMSFLQTDSDPFANIIAEL